MMRERILTVRRNAARYAVLGGLFVAAAANARPGRAVNAALEQSVGMPPARVAPAVREHSLKLLDGHDAGLAGRRGEVLVVNFWATWCRPCQRELPELQRLHQQITPRGGRVVAVSIDAERANVERYVRGHKLTLPVAWDGPEGLARQLDLGAVPLTLVFDRSGAVVWASTRTDAEGLADTREAALRALAVTPTLAGDADGGTR